jgi:amidase
MIGNLCMSRIHECLEHSACQASLVIRAVDHGGGDSIMRSTHYFQSSLILRGKYTGGEIHWDTHDIDAFLGARPEMPMKKLKDIVESGKFHPAIELLPELAQGPEVPTAQADYYERYTARETFQRIIINQMAKVGASAVVFPTTNIPSPTRVDLDAGKWGTFTFPTNTLIAAQSWMPAISVPAGFTTQGLPVGMEILGLPYREADLLSLAYAFEQATNHRRPSAILPELV